MTDVQSGSPVRARAPAVKGWAIALLIGITPLLAMILTWHSGDSPPSSLLSFSKNMALGTLASELLIILVAARADLFRQHITAPRATRLAAITFAAIAIGTALFVAADPVTAVIRTIILGVHCLFAWAVFHLCLRQNLIRAEATSAIIAGFAASTAALISFVVQIDDPSNFDWMHGLPGYGNIRRLGYYAAPVVGLCLGRLAIRQDSGGRLVAFVVATLALGTIFWSGSRGAFAAIIVGYVVSACFFPRMRKMQPLLGFVAGSLLAAAIASVPTVHSINMGVGRVFGWTPNGGASDVTSGRTAVWLDSLGAIANRPLFGYGEGQARLAVPLLGELQLVHPHNVLLQTLLAWGAVGTGLLLFLALPWAARLIKHVRQADGEFLPPAIGLLVIVAHAGVDGTLYHAQSLALFSALAGIVHVRRRQSQGTSGMSGRPHLLPV